jgi:hypothetical protein
MVHNVDHAIYTNFWIHFCYPCKPDPVRLIFDGLLLVIYTYINCEIYSIDLQDWPDPNPIPKMDLYKSLALRQNDDSSMSF